jgi:hypothetical protein
VDEAEAAVALRRLRDITEAHGLSALAREIDSAIDEVAVRKARDVPPREHLRFVGALAEALTLAGSLHAATPRLLTDDTDAQRATLRFPSLKTSAPTYHSHTKLLTSRIRPKLRAQL